MLKRRGRRAVYLLFLVTVNLALFLPSMSGEFLWDDKYFISENPHIQGSGFLRTFLVSPFGGASGTDENSRRLDSAMRFYRPLVSLSYWVDFKIWGLNAAAFHLTNILVHTINAIVLFYIFIGLAFGSRAGFLGALLFSAFPLHFESVSWISGRTDLLACLFAGLSVLSFILFLKKRTHLALLGSGAAYFLGLLCKENVIFLPLIYLLVLYRREGKTAAVFRQLWPHALALFGWAFLRWNALGAASAGGSGRSVPDLLAAIGFYGWKTVWPFGLSLTVDPVRVFPDLGFRLLGALLAAGFFFSAWQAWRRRPAADRPDWAYPAWMLLVLPSAAVIFSPSAISLLAWRFLYLPSAVLLGALVYFLELRLKPKALAIGVVVLLAGFYAAEIYPKNRQFGKDETGFWLGIKDHSREDVIARFNLAVKTLPSNEDAALGLFDGILTRTDQPSYPYWRTRVLEELAVYYAFRKEFGRAEAYFGELFRLEPRPSPRLSFNYAFYLAFAGKKKEGEKAVGEMLEQLPGNHFALVQAAKFYVIVRDYEEAARLYAEDFRLFRTRQSRLLAEQAARLAQPGR